jgi:hypothetical protein
MRDEVLSGTTVALGPLDAMIPHPQDGRFTSYPTR